MQMKKVFLIFVSSLFFSYSVSAGNISGQWRGRLKERGVYPVLDLRFSGGSYSATLEGIDPDGKTLRVSFLSFEEPVLRFEADDGAIYYRGVLGEDGIIRGFLIQKGTGFKTDFARNNADAFAESSENCPYKREKIYFSDGKTGKNFAGALTLPDGAGPFPAIIVTDSNAARNEKDYGGGRFPFSYVSDYFVRSGFAVFVCEGGGTASSFWHNISAALDCAGGVRSAFEYLKTRKDIDIKKTGIIAHGQGAPASASCAAGEEGAAFLVLLAGAGLAGKDMALKSYALVGKASGTDRKTLKRDLKINKNLIAITAGRRDRQQKRQAVIDYLGKTFDSFKPGEMPKGMSRADFMRMYIGVYNDEKMQQYLVYDPADALKKISCPVFAAGGGKDLQVPAGQNLKAVKKALRAGGNKDITVEYFPELNHFFRKAGASCAAGTDEPFSARALEKIREWIKSKIK